MPTPASPPALPRLCAAALLAAPLPAAAGGATATAFPPMLRGDVAISYDLDSVAGRMVEGEEDVGRLRHRSHVITYEAAFSLYHGLGIYVQVPQFASESVAFEGAQTMAYDPRAEAGTMIGTEPLGALDPVTGSGVGGVWLGLRGAPMHQDIFEKRGDRVSWVLDAGVRFRDKTPFWTYGPRGERGAGPGAPAFRFIGAASTTHRRSSPYLVAEMVRAGRLETDVVAEGSEVLAEGVTLRPASSVTVTPGVELHIVDYGQGASFSLDLRGRYGYQSWQDLPSGIFLPSTLDASRGLVATMSETSRLTLGGGVHWRFIDYLQMDVLADVGVRTGGQLEHLYPVRLELGALEWQLQAALRLRVRDSLISALQPAG